jgi:hypothetical protein
MHHMALRHGLMALGIGLAALTRVGLAEGAAAYAERSVDELKLMTTQELAGEARMVCHHVLISLDMARACLESGSTHGAEVFYREAEQRSAQAIREQAYLQRVGLVLRAQHHGQMPAWFKQITRAVESRQDPDCDTAAAGGWWAKL